MPHSSTSTPTSTPTSKSSQERADAADGDAGAEHERPRAERVLLGAALVARHRVITHAVRDPSVNVDRSLRRLVGVAERDRDAEPGDDGELAIVVGGETHAHHAGLEPDQAFMAFRVEP